jgi:hypothetical protein
MNAALKTNVVPFLRSHGFKGSYPHFRRPLPDYIDVLTFQFDTRGGGFVVEMGSCSSAGVTLHWGKHVLPSEVIAWDLHPTERRRLSPSGAVGPDYWFRFEAGDYLDVARRVTECLTNAWSGRDHCARTARDLRRRTAAQAHR